VRLLDRYILRNFLQIYSYCIAAFLSIWLIYDVSDNLSTFLDAHMSLTHVLNYYLTQLPAIMVVLLPVSLLLALLFCLGRMSRANEIVSMLTAGVSLPRALVCLFTMGVLTSLGSAALNYSLAPHADQARRDFLDPMGRRQEKGVVAQDVDRNHIAPTSSDAAILRQLVPSPDAVVVGGRGFGGNVLKRSTRPIFGIAAGKIRLTTFNKLVNKISGPTRPVHQESRIVDG
jgi:hypothetical protein